jgi:hypothetical protein
MAPLINRRRFAYNPVGSPVRFLPDRLEVHLQTSPMEALAGLIAADVVAVVVH